MLGVKFLVKVFRSLFNLYFNRIFNVLKVNECLGTTTSYFGKLYLSYGFDKYLTRVGKLITYIIRSRFINFAGFRKLFCSVLKVLFSLDHKVIGLLYLSFGILFGMSGVFLSLLIRTELLLPGYYTLSGSDTTYNSIITSHGFLMIFFSAMPIFISGLGNFIVPLAVGTRDMAFPILNNVAFIIFILSFLVFQLSCGTFSFTDLGVSYGWTIIPPLSTSGSSYAIDFLILSLHMNGIASLLNALNTIITIQFCSGLNKWHIGLFT